MDAYLQFCEKPLGVNIVQLNELCVHVVVESTERQPGRREPAPLESDQPVESAESHVAGEEHGEQGDVSPGTENLYVSVHNL